jgi:hypothetical protein
LEMNEKTPPWCLSVSNNASNSTNPTNHSFLFPQGLLVCRRVTGLRGPKKRDSGCMGRSSIRTIGPCEHSQVG